MKTVKKLGLTFALISCAAMLFARGKDLSIWSFTPEIKVMAEKYYQQTHKDVNVLVSEIPTEDFPLALESAIETDSLPDVIALEDAFVRKYIEQGDKYLMDLTPVYSKVKGKMIPYPAEVGTFNGKVYGLSWQACPGAMFYRRSLAKKYLGTDDPEAVQDMVANWYKFLNTARVIKEKSRGKCIMVSSLGDLDKPFVCARKNPWLVNGKLTVDEMMIIQLDVAKKLAAEGLAGNVGTWSREWNAGINGQYENEKGKSQEVFCYFLPTWGLHYVLKPNGKNTAGDWAMCEGPSAYRWGGTWIAVSKKAENPELAKDFVSYITSDDAFLTKWAKDTGDFVANNNVINAVKGEYSEPFLKGQNHYEQFSKMANKVNGKLNFSTDQAIEKIWYEVFYEHVWGIRTNEESLAKFRERVKTQLGYQ